VKNRWLMRMKNMTLDLYRRNWFPTTFRDAVAVGGCLFGEFSSLRGFPIVGRNFRRSVAKRRQIMERRKASDEYMAAWFSYRPVSYPAPHVAARVVEKEDIASR